MLESLDVLLQRVTMQQEQITKARPLPQATLRSLLDDFLIRFAHDTTALEGNTLTFCTKRKWCWNTALPSEGKRFGNTWK